jgi:hypothetical protein
MAEMKRLLMLDGQPQSPACGLLRNPAQPPGGGVVNVASARRFAVANAVPPSTPQTTVDSVIWTVLERGLKALREPANQERLLQCDAQARAQINKRIETLLATDRIPGGADDV